MERSHIISICVLTISFCMNAIGQSGGGQQLPYCGDLVRVDPYNAVCCSTLQSPCSEPNETRWRFHTNGQKKVYQHGVIYECLSPVNPSWPHQCCVNLDEGGDGEPNCADSTHSACKPDTCYTVE